MVLEYVVHCLGDGAHLRDVMQEEYVRHLVSPDEIEEILGNPRLIEAARKKMEEDLSSGKLDLRRPTRRVNGPSQSGCENVPDRGPKGSSAL